MTDLLCALASGLLVAFIAVILTAKFWWLVVCLIALVFHLCGRNDIARALTERKS